MDKDEIQFNRLLVNIGNSVGLIIPIEHLGNHKSGDAVRVTLKFLDG